MIDVVKNKSGFTLVELAIVLVIIGLLIGGILAAQSMINTTKIQATIRQFSQFDITIANFQTKYNQLPGDSTLFPNSGNNDGIITSGGGGYSDTRYAWNHLSLGVGLMNAQGVAYQPMPGYNAASYTETYCPRLQITDPAYLHCIVLTSPCCGVNYNDYEDFNTGGSATPASYGFLGRDASAIDLKIDDGKRSSGNVFYSGAPGPDYCSGSGTGYNVTTNVYGCVMHFKIGLTNGIAN